MSLHISINTPHPELENSPVYKAILFVAMQAAVERQQGRLPSGPALDITFMLSTRYDAPAFSGMRMGGYSDDNRTLFFETAVPVHITQSAAAPNYVDSVLEDMVENARDYFREYHIDFDDAQWNRTLSCLASRGSTNRTAH